MSDSDSQPNKEKTQNDEPVDDESKNALSQVTDIFLALHLFQIFLNSPTGQFYKSKSNWK
jgi:hypothetical protein